MSSVYIPLPVETIEEEAEKPSRTYRLDLDAGRIVGFTDGLDSVNQAIRKAIVTPRFRCLIYSDQYGSEITDAIIAKDVTPEYIETTIPAFIKDALKPDTRILDVYDFSFEFKDDGVFVSFRADTIYGESLVEVVM